jgi:hypothetical protein
MDQGSGKSFKLQASSLTMVQGSCRMYLERNIMFKEWKRTVENLPEELTYETRKDIMEIEQLKRIADAIEEILRLVKKDMEPREKNKK